MDMVMTMPLTTAPVVRQGLLQKSAGVGKHRRFLVLTALTLRWSSSEAADKVGDYRNVCDLSDVRDVQRISKRTFVIMHHSCAREWTAKSYEDASLWVQALQRALSNSELQRLPMCMDDEIAEVHGTWVTSPLATNVKWDSELNVGHLPTGKWFEVVLGGGTVVKITERHLEMGRSLVPVDINSEVGMVLEVRARVVEELGNWKAHLLPALVISFASFCFALHRVFGDHPYFIYFQLALTFCAGTLAPIMTSGALDLHGSLAQKSRVWAISLRPIHQQHFRRATISPDASPLRGRESRRATGRSSLPSLPAPMQISSSSTPTCSLTPVSSPEGSMSTFEKEAPELEIPHRYIAGCQGDIVEARRRWELTLKWRKEERIDTILDEPQPHFEVIKEHYPHFLCGRSREGHLVYYERPGKVDMKALAAAGLNIDDMVRYYVYICEVLWVKMDTRDDRENWGRLVTVFDCEGIRLRDAFGVRDSRKS
jgi:hypothetical protein